MWKKYTTQPTWHLPAQGQLQKHYKKVWSTLNTTVNILI